VLHYNQTCIGDCGHLCGVWPQVTTISGKNPRVICDECTKVQYDIPENERLFIWVAMKPDPKPPTKRAPRKPAAPKPRTAMQRCLEQAGLF
jgi:hypothetical protein